MVLGAAHQNYKRARKRKGAGIYIFYLYKPAAVKNNETIFFFYSLFIADPATVVKMFVFPFNLCTMATGADFENPACASPLLLRVRS